LKGWFLVEGVAELFSAVNDQHIGAPNSQMEELITLISALVLIWSGGLIPGLSQFTGFFIGVGLSSWIVDELFSSDQ